MINVIKFYQFTCKIVRYKSNTGILQTFHKTLIGHIFREGKMELPDRTSGQQKIAEKHDKIVTFRLPSHVKGSL